MKKLIYTLTVVSFVFGIHSATAKPNYFGTSTDPYATSVPVTIAYSVPLPKPLPVLSTTTPVSDTTPSTAGLRIIAAAWGEGSKLIDVTGQTMDLLRQPADEFQADAQWLRSDPSKGARKTLAVTFELDGARYTIVAAEGSKISVRALRDYARANRK